ncbi:MAG: thioredoxin domain-containing protein [Candidatus Levybacteria bacterium]|nr:thioredoxin domain-containing protein [Candidatus Levybacteria bacterium]MDZ4227784.1 thioredoxin domain-containing protein [Candidatus Levybacteria bacterium]
MKQIGIWVGVIAIFALTTWGLIAVVNSKGPSSTQAIAPPAISKDDQILGASTQVKAILIEYADFQCPACKNYASLVRQLKQDFGDDLLIAYRFFPLINIHKTAMPSSQAAYAAGKQNKFWEMSDMIHENQENWADSAKAEDLFTGYAKELNLDITQFTNDYNADSTLKFILDQMNSGISIGINSTPTFFLNGKIIQNPQSYEAFKELIKNELKKE